MTGTGTLYPLGLIGGHYKFTKFMDKNKVSNLLRKQYPNWMAKYSLEIDDYLSKLSTTTEAFAAECATKYLLVLEAKDKVKKEKKEQKERIKNCELCGGSGVLDDPVFDDDSKSYHPTGSRKCDCQL